MEQNNGKIINDLTSRQWRLYDFLKSHPNRKFSTREIYLLFIDEYPNYEIGTDWNSSHTRRQIAFDIEAIAKSKRVHHVITRSINKIGVLDKEQTMEFLNHKAIILKKQIKELYEEFAKAGLDGQLRLVFGKEAELIEAFAKGE